MAATATLRYPLPVQPFPHAFTRRSGDVFIARTAGAFAIDTASATREAA